MDTKRGAKGDNHFPDCASRSSKVLPAFSCRLPVPSRQSDFVRARHDNFSTFFRLGRSTIALRISPPESDRSLFRRAADSRPGARKSKRRRATARSRRKRKEFFETSGFDSRRRFKIFQAFSNSSSGGQEQNKFRSP